MSENEIRTLLKKACAELDRHAHSARKAMLPAALGASLALTGCPGTPKHEAGPADPVKTDPVEQVADAGQALVVDPPPEETPVADAGQALIVDPPAEETPVADAAVPVAPRERPDYDIKRPYMAPDAVPLHEMLKPRRAV